MQSLLTSIPLVAVAEIGDKTQLLSLVLAARYRKSLPIIAGITAATLLNHGISALLGQWLGVSLQSWGFSLFVAVAFIAIGLWVLKPDEDDGLDGRLAKFGPLVASFLAFFFAEIGDKTQLATIALASEYQSILWVTLGTTIGMLLANVPVVVMGERLMGRVPFRAVRIIAASAFMAFGIYQLLRLI
jgi:putative Ca2+/H+ antiporter (TMEM165/GDT1 family)